MADDDQRANDSRGETRQALLRFIADPVGYVYPDVAPTPRPLLEVVALSLLFGVLAFIFVSLPALRAAASIGALANPVESAVVRVIGLSIFGFLVLCVASLGSGLTASVLAGRSATTTALRAWIHAGPPFLVLKWFGAPLFAVSFLWTSIIYVLWIRREAGYQWPGTVAVALPGLVVVLASSLLLI